MRDEWSQKYLPAERLIELLQQVPAGSRVYPNAVKNLLFTTPEGDELGYIDFLLEGKVERFTT